MTDRDRDREMGEISATIKMAHEMLNKIDAKVDIIVTTGCIKGKANEVSIDILAKRVDKIDGLLAKAVVIGLIVAGGGASIPQIVKAFFAL